MILSTFSKATVSLISAKMTLKPRLSRSWLSCGVTLFALGTCNTRFEIPGTALLCYLQKADSRNVWEAGQRQMGTIFYQDKEIHGHRKQIDCWWKSVREAVRRMGQIVSLIEVPKQQGWIIRKSTNHRTDEIQYRLTTAMTTSTTHNNREQFITVAFILNLKWCYLCLQNWAINTLQDDFLELSDKGWCWKKFWKTAM